MKKSASSKRWCQEHESDFYVKEAHRLGYRSRASFKLLQIQQRDQLIKPGNMIIDLGAAPGGWSQVASTLVGPSGQVIAVDLLAMDPLPNTTFIQGDFQAQSTLDAIIDAIGNREVDVIVSDMAPNTTGVTHVDQLRSIHLAELALDLANQYLKPGGHFLTKLFQGPGFDDFYKALRTQFNRVITRKPEASRKRSKEIYSLALERRSTIE